MALGVGSVALPPVTLSDQLKWPITAGTVPTAAGPGQVSTMQDLPAEVQALFQHKPRTHQHTITPSQLDLATGDDSVICTDPDWVTYWQRQGNYEQICHTDRALWTMLAKLHPLAGRWRIDCEALQKHLVGLYQEKARTVQAIREHMIATTRWQQRAAYLEQQLQNIARQIQGQFPAHLQHGLSEPKEQRQWEALYPNLDRATQKIIDELKHCYAQLHGPSDANVQMDILKRDLELLRVQTRQYDSEYDKLREQLNGALDIIRALVNQLIDKGYSLRAIDKYLDPNGQADVAELFSTPQRYQFAAVTPPPEAPLIEQDSLRADMDKLAADMEHIKTMCQQPGQHARHPFPQRDVWYTVPSNAGRANQHNLYQGQWIVADYCDATVNKTRCMRECVQHVCEECDNGEPCERQCGDACHVHQPCTTP